MLDRKEAMLLVLLICFDLRATAARSTFQGSSGAPLKLVLLPNPTSYPVVDAPELLPETDGQTPYFLQWDGSNGNNHFLKKLLLPPDFLKDFIKKKFNFFNDTQTETATEISVPESSSSTSQPATSSNAQAVQPILLYAAQIEPIRQYPLEDDADLETANYETDHFDQVFEPEHFQRCRKKHGYRRHRKPVRS